jgi:WD40 repeat protein
MSTVSSPIAKMQEASTIKPRQTMRGHTDWVRYAAHLPDERRVMTCAEDGSLRVWDLESGVQIGDDWRDEGNPTEGVITMALSPNGKTVAAGSRSGTVSLWDVETEKVIAKWRGHIGVVGSVCWAADGRRVASGSDDGTVRVWDMENGKIVLGPIMTGHKNVYAVVYSPDASMIATGGYEESGIKIWDANTGSQLFSTLKHDTEVLSLAWTSDQKKLISGSMFGSISIFDTATWQQIAILDGHQDAVYAISLFRSDRLFASASWDNTARLWNLDTNLQVGLPLQHEDGVNAAAISSDGELLVTASRDTNAYTWDIYTILKDVDLEDLLSIPEVSVSRL